MSIEIRRLTLNDYEQAIDFLNLVFGQDHCPHEFRTLLPWAYRPTEECMACQLAVVENGRIRSSVGTFTRDFMVAGHRLTDVGVGNVAVHRDHRGKGYMTMLMDRAVQEMADSGADTSCLGGRRERYRHFGYEMAGCGLEFNFSRFSVSHLGRTGGWPPYRFAPLEGAWTASAIAMHDTQPLRCLRPAEGFDALLRSWHAQPMAILDEAGMFAGYLVLSSKGDCISELLLTDDDALVPVLFALITERGLQGLELRLQPHQRDLITRAMDRCEGMTLSPNMMLHIFRFDTVVSAWLALKALWTPLMDGSRVLKTDLGSWRVTVEGGLASVTAEDGSPDITLPGLAVYPMLTGPVIRSIGDPLLDNWFPLPICFASPDHV